MKYQMTTIFFCLITLFSFGQSSPVKSFVKDLPRAQRKHVNKFTVGRIPIGIARWFVDKEYKPVLKQVKKLRILSVENVENIDPRLMTKLYDKVDKKNYQELVEIRNKGERIFLRAKENEDTLKELIVLVNDGSELTMIELKGKIDYNQLEKLIHKYTANKSLSM